MKRIVALTIAVVLLAGLFDVQGGAAQPAAAEPAPASVAVYPMPSMLQNVELRKAVSYCTDKAALVQSVYTLLNPSQVASLVRDSFVSPVSWAYHTPSTLYPYNPAAGQAILTTQGWLLAPGDTYRKNAEGKELVIEVTSTTAQFRKTYLAVFESQMAACGIHVVRSHVSSTWFFGQTSGLARRDFEMGVWAWVSSLEPMVDLYACYRIPTPRNGWMGQNFSGWCNTTADDAIKIAMTSYDKPTRQTALVTVQNEFGKDAPVLPLFTRMELFAHNNSLTGFTVFEGDMSLLDTRNQYASRAYQWTRSGFSILSWGMASEPSSLFPVEFDSAGYQIMQAAGVPYTSPNYTPQPMLQTNFATIGSGATNATVSVSAGQKVVDANGNVRVLASGVKVRDASGNLVTYASGSVNMKQLTDVSYTFLTGLEWNDGTPVSQADFQLGYDIACSPDIDYSNYGAYCEMAQNFSANSHGYQITWLPGYDDKSYFLAPFPYFPAHRPIVGGVHNGKTLSQVPASDWRNLPEVSRTPWSAGPYYVSSWVGGSYIELTKNDHSIVGVPATAKIRVKFVADPEAALLADTVDIVGTDSLFALTSALNTAPNVTRVIIPSQTWEHLDFNFHVFPKTFLPVIGK